MSTTEPMPSAIRCDIIRWLSIIIVAGFTLSVFYHYSLGAYLGYSYPYNTFLFLPRARLSDFFNFYRSNIHRNPYFDPADPLHSNYGPLASIFFMVFFTWLPRHVAVVLFISVFIGAYVWINAMNLRSDNLSEWILNTFIFSFLTYPFLFNVDRANLECYIFLFLWFFLHFTYIRPKPRLGAIFLAIATAIKIYPAIFLVLLASDKKWKQAGWTILMTIFFILAPLLALRGGFMANLRCIMGGFGYVGTILQMTQRGPSLWTTFKIWTIESGQGGMNYARALKIYSLIVMAISVPLFLYVIFVEKKLWRKVLLLTAAMLLFPFVSADYKLIHIALPLFFFIQACGAETPQARYKFTAAFGLLLIPKDFFYFSKVFTDAGGAADLSWGIIVNQLILLWMCGEIVVQGLASKYSTASGAVEFVRD